MKDEDSSPPSDPEERARAAVLYRKFDLIPPWERSEQQKAREEKIWQEILAGWEKPPSRTN
jgi:hypothetical protein